MMGMMMLVMTVLVFSVIFLMAAKEPQEAAHRKGEEE